MEHTYKDKYFSVLGDSLSTLAGYNPPECAVFYDWQNKYLAGIRGPEDTWWGRVIDALGGRLLVNNAWSGSLVCKHPACEIQSYGCSDARTAALSADGQSPDVVMVLMGLNDFGCGIGAEVFSAGYETMLKKLRRNYPHSEIWCLTLPVSYGSYNPGEHITDYSRAIRACAEKQSCKLVDIDRLDGPYDTVDGCHPTAQGMQTLARAVLRAIGQEAMQHDH